MSAARQRQAYCRISTHDGKGRALVLHSGGHIVASDFEGLRSPGAGGPRSDDDGKASGGHKGEKGSELEGSHWDKDIGSYFGVVG